MVNDCSGISLLLISALFGSFVSTEEYKYLGCYIDGQVRLLNGVKMDSPQQTPKLCAQYCEARSYRFAGLQFQKECFCGNSIQNGQLAGVSDCHYSCPGDGSVKCGGDWRLSVYETSFKPGIMPSAAYVGCFVDPSAESRLMRGARDDFKGRLTNPICQQFCRKSGMKYAGTQFSFECFCSNQRPSYKVMADENECDSNCDGAPSDKCGGKLRLSVYDLSPDGTDPVDSMYNGCYPVGTKGNLLSGARFDFNNLTPVSCISFCYKKGFTMAGMQMGNQCYCDDKLEKISRVSETHCNVPCKGNSLLKCGSDSHMNIYYTGVPDKSFVPRYHYLGCFQDSKERTLMGISKIDKGLVPKMCIEFCYRKNFLYAGTEFGEECFCSDELPPNKKVGERECNSRCKGDSSQRCGGSWKLSVYNVSITEYRDSILNRCDPSESRFGKNEVCKGQVMFIEDFNTSPIDEKKWTHSIYMPLAPDYQFVVLKNKEQNIYVKDGKLIIKPTIMDDYTVRHGKIELENCTSYIYSEECSKIAVSFSILPPVESALINTHNSFSFQYGKIEIRAKLPLGEWLVPALWLKPKYDSYGPFYSSGRIVMAMARGNGNLECDGRDLSSRTLEAGIMAGVKETMAKKMVELKLSEGWHAQFHNFSFTWTSESLSFSVDGGQENYLFKKGQNVKDVIGFDGPSVPWKNGTHIAPFDKEFYISLGLFAGGMTDFPDSCTSGEHPKPWKNKAVKAMANFWQAKDQWFGTWNSEDSALQIDYIKVIAV